MNIVFFAPFPPQKDGLSSYTSKLVTELRRRNHTVKVVATGGQISEERGVMARFGAGPWRFWRTLRAVIVAKPQIIHVQYTIPAFGLGSFALWLLLLGCRWCTGARVVVTFHEVKRETSLLGLAGLWYYRLITRVCHLMTVHTYEAADILINRCGVARGRVHVVPHPLYSNRKSAVDSSVLHELYRIEGKRIILCFGFIHVDKGLDYLIKAFDLLRRSDPQFKDTLLVIAGTVRERKGIFKWFERKDRAYEATLHQLIAARHLKKSVFFTGYVPEAQVPMWFTRAEVAVLPYTNLEQSGVLNQALTYRTPVVASALGGLKETLEDTKALVPPANAGALSNKLADLLATPALRETMVAHYEKIRRPRTIARVVSHLEELYEA